MKHFRFQLRENIIRGMNRQEYKAASRWLRSCARLIEAGIDWDFVNQYLANSMICGRHEIKYEDLII